MCSRVKYGTWAIHAPYQEQEAKKLVEAGFSPITAAVLCSRGYSCLSDAQKYLAADTKLSDPFELVDMDKAKARVLRAADAGEHIAVFGDYDVDGITATCLLTEFLRSLGAKVTSYIPARLEEGYGLNEIAIRALSEQGVKLIITVDCGITAVEEAELCDALGIDLVITDHHECKDVLPTACAVVDPHRRDQKFAHHDLAGVGVAFKLAAAISGDQEALLERFCDLLCLGTVADVMPLTGENRAVVLRGLRALEQPQRVGIAALMAECGCENPPVTAGTIGYTLAPRINAAGRMGQVEIATELFLTNDPKRAADLAQQLCRLNRKRQEIEAGIYQSAVSMLPTDAPPSAIVLADEDWHQGVVGIVASRLAEEYNCPTFLVCLDGEKGKASSRSYGGFNLFRALESLSDLLESYGGHELAAGFTIRRDRIDAFREAICARAEDFSLSDECCTALQIDCEIPPALLTLANVAALDELEPCGAGCPRPVLCMSGMTVSDLSEIGGGKHLRLRLTRGRHSFQAIFFSSTARRAGVSKGDVVDVAFTPQINEFRSSRSVQLNLVDIRPDDEFFRQEQSELALCNRVCAGRPLSAADAARIFPERQEFVGVWRYLSAAAEDGRLSDEIGSLARKISRFGHHPCSAGQLCICLEVFAEQGLLRLHRRKSHVHITICAGAPKADLSQSAILSRLKNQKAGE